MQESYFSKYSSLLNSISNKLKNHFSGVGIVFYNHLNGISHCSLYDHTYTLPQEDFNQIEVLLTNICNIDSPYHDGFIFIDAAQNRLTHIGQFISPPIKHLPLPTSPIGAREMTALLTSTVDGIEATYIIKNNNKQLFFDNGRKGTPNA